MCLCLLAGGAVSCDTAVDLPDEPPRAFSMWGALTPDRDTQTVRVFPMGSRLESLPGDTLDARLTSLNLETGRRRVWSDSVVRENDGDNVHVFWAPFTAEHGHTYRVQISDARRGTSRAEVTVPERVELEPLPHAGRRGQIRARVRIPDSAPQVLPRAELDYLVQVGAADPQAGLLTNDVRTTVQVDNPIESASDGWRIRIPLDEHAVQVDGRVGGLRQRHGLFYTGPCCGLDLLMLTVEVTIVNEEWKFPSESLSPTVVAQPGLISNVENGFGLIGGGYEERVIVPVPDSVAKAARFRYDFF